ncbi:MAG: replicative DNA helicase [Candidatus Aquicultorales bacterium]
MVMRIPPHNIEAEQSLLGAMLLNQDAIASAVEVVDADSFYAEAHKLVYKAIVGLWMDAQPADAVTVVKKLGEDLAKIGGRPYLHTLVSVVPSTSNARYYAGIVRDAAERRALVKAAAEIAEIGYSTEGETEEVLDRAESIVFSVAHRQIAARTVGAEELFTEAYTLIANRYEHKANVTGIASGITGLDNLTAGWQKGDLIILAARPSMGKTALALHFGLHAVKGSVPTAVFSIEMSKDLLAERIYAATAGVNSKNLRTGFMSNADWEKIAYASGSLITYPLFIDDTPALSLAGLRAKTRRIFARTAPGLVVVDYLQLMQGSGKSDNRFQEISEISRGLKVLAKELDCPVVALSQMSRNIENREDKVPRLSDLRESGQLEQDADLVIFIHRERDRETKELQPEASLVVAKHRNGPCGTVKLYYHAPFLRFTEVEARRDQQQQLGGIDR